MKQIWFPVILLFLLLLFCTAAMYFTCCYTEHVLSLLHEGERLAAESRFAEAAEQIEEASRFWASHAGFFGVVLRHTEADNVRTGFQAVLAYAVHENEDEFFGGQATAPVFTEAAQDITGIGYKGEKYFPVHNEILNALKNVQNKGADPEKEWDAAVKRAEDLMKR